MLFMTQLMHVESPAKVNEVNIDGFFDARQSKIYHSILGTDIYQILAKDLL